MKWLQRNLKKEPLSNLETAHHGSIQQDLRRRKYHNPSSNQIQDEYILSYVYKSIDSSLAFPYDWSVDILPIERSDVDLIIWFEFGRPLTT